MRSAPPPCAETRRREDAGSANDVGDRLQRGAFHARFPGTPASIARRPARCKGSIPLAFILPPLSLFHHFLCNRIQQAVRSFRESQKRELDSIGAVNWLGKELPDDLRNRFAWFRLTGKAAILSVRFSRPEKPHIEARARFSCCDRAVVDGSRDALRVLSRIDQRKGHRRPRRHLRLALRMHFGSSKGVRRPRRKHRADRAHRHLGFHWDGNSMRYRKRFWSRLRGKVLHRHSRRNRCGHRLRSLALAQGDGMPASFFHPPVCTVLPSIVPPVRPLSWRDG